MTPIPLYVTLPHVHLLRGCPTGSVQFWNPRPDRRRTIAPPVPLFLKGVGGHRPVFGDSARHRDYPAFRGHVLVCDYFHGDTGRGIGAADPDPASPCCYLPGGRGFSAARPPRLAVE
jgi:hypothetical protein